jgi:hypothetical protein
MRPLRAAALGAAAVLALATLAGAKTTGTPAGFVVRYPSGDAADYQTLVGVMQNPAVSTIVFVKGTHLFNAAQQQPLFVFKRNDLTICGETGDPKDVVIECSARSVFQIEQANGTVFRGITVRSTYVDPLGLPIGGIGILVNAVPSATAEGFADDTTIERCNFEAFVGVQASVRAENLSVSDCGFTCTALKPTSTVGGAGLLWEDGRGLSVTRSRFKTDTGVSAIAGIFVRGAQTSNSAGDRARQLLITNNTVQGDFTAGLDLADVVDAVVRRNKVTFEDTGTNLTRGRVGIAIRRAAATEVPEGYEVTKNVVRKAHYGIWFLSVGDGYATKNDLRGCGSREVDGTGGVAFQDHGGAVRVNLLGGQCKTVFAGNDFRDLKSPIEEPAVVVFPPGPSCATAQPANRVDRGRPLFSVANP